MFTKKSVTKKSVPLKLTTLCYDCPICIRSPLKTFIHACGECGKGLRYKNHRICTECSDKTRCMTCLRVLPSMTSENSSAAIRAEDHQQWKTRLIVPDVIECDLCKTLNHHYIDPAFKCMECDNKTRYAEHRLCYCCGRGTRCVQCLRVMNTVSKDHIGAVKLSWVYYNWRNAFPTV